MFRTYEIRGSHPEYRVPKPGGGRLDNKLGKDIESKLMHKSVMGTKNFIRENIKKQKELEEATKRSRIGRCNGSVEAETKSREMSPGKTKVEFSVSKFSAKK